MDKNKIDYSELGKERIITVVDLIREIGRRIWIVIVLAAVFALILGAYKYHKDVQSAARAADSVATVVADSSLTEEEIAEVKNVMYVKDNLDDLQNYVDHSVLMQIDAADESRVTLQYRVNISDEETSGMTSRDVMLLYQGYVTNGALASGLMEGGYDLDMPYLQELIGFTAYSDSTDANNVDSEESTETTSSFVLTITHANQTSAEELADLVEDELETYQDTLTDQIGTNELTLIDRSYSRVVNTNRRTYKYDRINNITTLQNRVEELESDLSSSQQELLKQYEEMGYSTMEGMESSIEKDANVEAEQAVNVHISRRYVLVGILIGIVLAIIYIILAYVLRGSINSANDIRYLFGLRVIGEVKTSGNKKIRRGKGDLSYDQQIDLIVANLKSLCAENGITKILFNGNEKLEGDYKLAEHLGKEMEKFGIKTDYVMNLPYSASVIEQLDEYKVVILFEKIRYAKYNTMEDEIRTCLEHDVQIAGAIVNC